MYDSYTSDKAANPDEPEYQYDDDDDSDYYYEQYRDEQMRLEDEAPELPIE